MTTEDFYEGLFRLCSSDNRFPDSPVYTHRINTKAKRNMEIFLMRYALGLYDHRHTYREIGKIFNISGNRVMQILDRIERKLMHHSNDELRARINLIIRQSEQPAS